MRKSRSGSGRRWRATPSQRRGVPLEERRRGAIDDEDLLDLVSDPAQVGGQLLDRPRLGPAQRQNVAARRRSQAAGAATSRPASRPRAGAARSGPRGRAGRGRRRRCPRPAPARPAPARRRGRRRRCSRGQRRPRRARRRSRSPRARSRAAARRCRSAGWAAPRSSRTSPGGRRWRRGGCAAGRTADIRLTVARVGPGTQVEVGVLAVVEAERPHRLGEEDRVHPLRPAAAVLVALDLQQRRLRPRPPGGGSPSCEGRPLSAGRASGGRRTRGTPRCPPRVPGAARARRRRRLPRGAKRSSPTSAGSTGPPRADRVLERVEERLLEAPRARRAAPGSTPSPGRRPRRSGSAARSRGRAQAAGRRRRAGPPPRSGGGRGRMLPGERGRGSPALPPSSAATARSPVRRSATSRNRRLRPSRRPRSRSTASRQGAPGKRDSGARWPRRGLEDDLGGGLVVRAGP